jgi:predicted nucleotidyltransferase component of viral defense system
MVLLNHYGVEMGTSGLILNAESREEIFADKLVAFALRPNRLKNRDLWDIAWLHQHAVKPAFELIPLKLNDHQANPQDYLDAFMKRTRSLTDDESVAKAFWQEMTRFLPNAIVKEINHSPLFWSHLCHLMNEYVVSLTDRL